MEKDEPEFKETLKLLDDDTTIRLLDSLIILFGKSIDANKPSANIVKALKLVDKEIRNRENWSP